MSTVRHAAARTYRVLLALSAAVIVEVFVAGVGVFGALPGEDKPVSHEAFDDKFAVHAAIGGFLTGCPLRRCRSRHRHRKSGSSKEV